MPTLHNARALPQQAVALFSNMEDVSGILDPVDDTTKLPLNHLTTIDIPIGDRPDALRDLRLMGVTRESLFPGLDGAFASLASDLFHASAP
jgi:hypothetical protein